ncbi:MAG: superoxide dismutase [Parvibaculum sp.]|nr:superoxide dismutase [Parvibaculum sp.]
MLELPPLPYEEDALAPHISAKTLSFHYRKHHKAYVDKANKAIAGTELDDLALVPLIRKLANDATQQSLFNNAAQVWNHDFYWRSMTPKGGGRPKGHIAERIDRDLGGYEKFRARFTETALGQFGSGYCWLVLGADGKLKIQGTTNAQTPIAGTRDVPLLTTDVWEHSYYLDYQHERAAYIDAFLDNLINWDFAETNLAAIPQREAIE